VKKDNDIASQVKVEKTAILYRENKQGLLMSLLVVSILCFVLGTQIDVFAPLIWWLVLSSVLLFRMLLFVKFQTSGRLTADNVDYWHKLFLVGTIIYGLSWGLAAPFFASQLEFELMLLMVMIMISLCIGAVPYLFYSMFAIEGYLVTIMAPITLWLYWQSEISYAMTALVCTVFMISTYIMARKLNLLMTNTMRLQLENSGLSSDLIRANYELKKLSSTDPLSGIANRRAFEKEFEKVMAQSRRNKVEISLLMFDIDHFKHFNDEYGHIAGDKLIRIVAQAIKRLLKRPADMVARYGGEEFIVMLPDTDIHGAISVADVIREEVSMIDIEKYAKADVNITISCGVTTIDANQVSSLYDYVRLADQALYVSKREGRNRTSTVLPDNE